MQKRGGRARTRAREYMLAKLTRTHKRNRMKLHATNMTTPNQFSRAANPARTPAPIIARHAMQPEHPRDKLSGNIQAATLKARYQRHMLPISLH